MIVVYLSQMSGSNADVSYNSAWLGLWALAEISVGVSVTGTFLLPKFLEAKGPKLRGLLGRQRRSLFKSPIRMSDGTQWRRTKKNPNHPSREELVVEMGRHHSSSLQSDPMTSSSFSRDQQQQEEEDVERQCIPSCNDAQGR